VLVACHTPDASAPTLPVAFTVEATPAAIDAGSQPELPSPEPDAGVATPVVDAGPPGCKEAHALLPVDADAGMPDGEVELDAARRYDDLSEHAGSPDAGLVHVTDGTRTYTLEGDYTNELVARDGSKVLWSVAGYPVAGGIFGVGLSWSGRVVSRSYSRGNSEIFDARSGARYAEVGRDVVVDPTDSYAVDPPTMQWFANHFDRAEVRKLSLARAPATARTVARLPIDPRKDYASANPDENPEFGVAICATGALYVVSHANAELALYRASDDAKLASVRHPPSGRPAFTRSGRFVLIHGASGSASEGKIVAVYRLDPR
jgi:hypothetical protein